MGDGALLIKAAARVKVIFLAFALALGAASTATAAPLIINTDASWLATNALPASTWNTDPSFNTTGWVNAVDLGIPGCPGGSSCIWYDGQFSGTQFAWLRKTFTISDPISAASLIGGVDDDVDVYLNGILVYSDHNGTAQNFGPLNVAAFLVQGVNLIAVAAADNFAFGRNHAFAASLQIQTQTQQVPEPASLALLGIGMAALAARRRHKA